MMSTPPNISKLSCPEWCIVLLFCAILMILSVIALSKHPKPLTQNPHSSHTQPLSLEVAVRGAVARPGTYQLPLNSLVKDLVDLGKPLPNADMSQINLRKRLYDEQVIHVPERLPITIYLEGAVEQSGPFQILSGTRYYELADQIKALPEADLKAVKRLRRYLQEGDVVQVPVKKLKKSNKV